MDSKGALRAMGQAKQGAKQHPFYGNAEEQMDSHDGNSTRLVDSGAADAATTV